MGVQVYAGMLAQQPRRHVQLFRGAGQGEARGHRVEQTALAVPALDQRLAVAVAALGGVGQVVRRVAVHHHLAGDQAQVQAPGGLEQRFHRLPVHAAEDQRGGGAVAQQFLQEDLGDLVGMGLVAELALGGEGIGVQPVQQLFAVGGDHPGLREMDVGIDEAGVISASRYSKTSTSPISPSRASASPRRATLPSSTSNRPSSKYS